jgi:hypothetical protein
MKSYFMLLRNQVLQWSLRFCKVKIQKWMVATIGVKRGNTGGLGLIIVSRKICQRKPEIPMVLQMECVNMAMLFKNSMDSLFVAIGFGVKRCQQS